MERIVHLPNGPGNGPIVVLNRRPSCVGRVQPDEFTALQRIRILVGCDGGAADEDSALIELRISRGQPQTDVKVIQHINVQPQTKAETITIPDMVSIIVGIILFKAAAEIAIKFVAGDPGRGAHFGGEGLIELFVAFLARLIFDVLRLLLSKDALFDQGIEQSIGGLPLTVSCHGSAGENAGGERGPVRAFLFHKLEFVSAGSGRRLEHLCYEQRSELLQSCDNWGKVT